MQYSLTSCCFQVKYNKVALVFSLLVESTGAGADSLDDFMKGLDNQLERRKKVEIKHQIYNLKKVCAICWLLYFHAMILGVSQAT